jgi:hypothetical protein
MALKIWNGSAWTSVSATKVWNGSSWVNATNGRIWNGSAWVTFFPTLGFSPNTGFVVDDSQVASPVASSTASFQLNSDGSVTKNGNTTNDGPTKWVDPTFSGVGANYEAQIVVSLLVNSGTNSATYHTYTVLGTIIAFNEATPYTSAWTALSSNRITSAVAFSDSGHPLEISSLQGTVYIRQVGTSTPVTSVSFAISAEADSS